MSELVETIRSDTAAAGVYVVSDGEPPESFYFCCGTCGACGLHRNDPSMVVAEAVDHVMKANHA